MQVWLAAVKLEWENNAFERARMLLKKACDRAPTAKVWMKAALLERELEAPEAALKLIDTALPSYPTFGKLYMMAGQVNETCLPIAFIFFCLWFREIHCRHGRHVYITD